MGCYGLPDMFRARRGAGSGARPLRHAHLRNDRPRPRRPPRLANATRRKREADTSPQLLDYALTKAAIVAFTKSLAKQVDALGIRFNAVGPGLVWTPLQTSGVQPPERIPEFGAHVPLGRPGQPAEVAPVYFFRASQESSYATGEVYSVTGGSSTP